MNSFNIGEHKIGSVNDPVFIIAEIGQNHQGDLKVAKCLIDEAKRIGCNCVKLQKSFLPARFTKSALERSYIGDQSWGTTYGEHKKYLEFSIDQYKILQNYCEQTGIIFSASAMDEVSLEQLCSINVPFIKIGSGDANNFPLLRKAARIDVPLIISTGMQSFNTINKIVEIMKEANKLNFALLHCVSSYPTKVEDCNLLSIPFLQETYPDVIVGYSGHETDVKVSIAAVLLGSKIIERHITLDTKQKGSDHSCSLNPEEFEFLVRSIRSYEASFLSKESISLNLVLEYFDNDKDIRNSFGNKQERKLFRCEMACHKKLGKSVVTATCIKKGQIIEYGNVGVKVCEPSGMSAEQLDDCIGKIALIDLDEDVPLYPYHIAMIQ